MWLQNITVVTIKVFMYATGDYIRFVSRLLFRNKWFPHWLVEINVVVSCVLYRSFFLTAYRVITRRFWGILLVKRLRCTVNGAIVRAERRKSEAWVESAKERCSPDPNRTEPTQTPPLFYFTVTIVPCTISQLNILWALLIVICLTAWDILHLFIILYLYLSFSLAFLA